LGVWHGVDGPTPQKALTVEKLLTIVAGCKDRNHKRGQGSSWTVALEEEEGEGYYPFIWTDMENE
jgi:hypothetical protein